MIKLGRITTHRFTEALEPFGIRPRHVAALIELRDHGELSQQSLCGRLHVDPTNLVAILNELEQRGFATRRRDPQDRRRHIVEVSKKGLAVIEKASKVMDQVEEDLLQGLSAADREELEHALGTIWETSGGYEAWSVAADAEAKAA
jgi:DNA-binding MarR family transcriptional regulator